jgi:hypothetical protein
MGLGTICIALNHERVTIREEERGLSQQSASAVLIYEAHLDATGLPTSIHISSGRNRIAKRRVYNVLV